MTDMDDENINSQIWIDALYDDDDHDDIDADAFAFFHFFIFSGVTNI